MNFLIHWLLVSMGYVEERVLSGCGNFHGRWTGASQEMIDQDLVLPIENGEIMLRKECS